MAKQILIIDNWEVPKLIKYGISYTKQWGDDAGTDMSGESKGTLIGIFPKLSVEIGELDENEMFTFLSKCNKAKFNIDWYDAETKDIRTGISYCIDDYSIEIKNSKKMAYKPFSFDLVPNKKR